MILIRIVKFVSVFTGNYPQLLELYKVFWISASQDKTQLFQIILAGTISPELSVIFEIIRKIEWIYMDSEFDIIGTIELVVAELALD